MDVVGRSPKATTSFHSTGPHPTPYLRVLVSIELLKRLGFSRLAADFKQTWLRLYPSTRGSTIPKRMLTTFNRAMPLVVDVICFQPYPTLGNRSLVDVLRFDQAAQLAVEHAARGLAAGTVGGDVPPRYLIGAARVALDQRLAAPDVISKNFYSALTRG
jgi:hypothetical protein